MVVDLNQGDKLNDKNYDVWHCKIQYLLEERGHVGDNHVVDGWA